MKRVQFRLQGELVTYGGLINAGGIGRDHRQHSGVGGFLEGSDGQGCIHRWICIENEETSLLPLIAVYIEPALCYIW